MMCSTPNSPVGLTLPPPPPPADTGLQVVRIDSLEAALAKLNINVPVKDILAAIREGEEAKRAKLTAQSTERRAALSKFALHPPQRPSGLHFTTTSHFVRHPPRPEKADPLAKERRRRLIELTQQRFPDGRAPDPFTLTWLACSQGAAADSLPFVQASIIITSTEDQTDEPPRSVFQCSPVAWCDPVGDQIITL